MKKMIAMLLAVVMLLALATGCSDSGGNGGEDDYQVIRFAQAYDATTLDPQNCYDDGSYFVLNNVNEGLVIGYNSAEVPFLPSIYRNTVVCYSYSKSLSLPGERIGYVCVPDAAEDSEALFAAIAGAARVLGHVCAPSLQQRVVARCVKSRPNLAAYDRNREILYEALTSFGYECVKPNGAFYMFVKAPGGSAKAFSDLARAHDLLLVPGDDFGCPEFFRICTCVAPDMIARSLPVFEQVIKLANIAAG